MPAKKTTAKKTTARKTTARKTTVKKPSAKKTIARKPAVKTTAKKVPVKRTTARPSKTTAKRAPAKTPAVKARRGDLIVLDSAQVGSPPREGEVLQIIKGEVSVSYRVRWADGHQTLISPMSGTARIIRASAKA